jgi:FtsZ-interacting cell division protein ZipA
MSTWVWIVIAVAVVIVVLAVVWSAMRAKRSRALQDSFGREYDRTVDEAGDRRAAERELRERQKQHEQLDIRPLSPESRDRYIQRWQATQSRFVDDPRGAVKEADTLVQEVMQERGYPTKDFERRVADISVDHPNLVEKYRNADGIARASERGEASTEDMRHSVRHYRALFAELLDVDDDSDVEDVDDIHSRDDGRVETENVERLR